MNSDTALVCRLSYWKKEELAEDGRSVRELAIYQSLESRNPVTDIPAFEQFDKLIELTVIILRAYELLTCSVEYFVPFVFESFSFFDSLRLEENFEKSHSCLPLDRVVGVLDFEGYVVVVLETENEAFTLVLEIATEDGVLV